ncbi:MAG: S9 family peptidase [Bacteroidia bacterium]
MRKKSFVFALVCLHMLGLTAQEIGLENIWLRYDYYAQSPSNLRWMQNDQYYSVQEDAGIARYSIENGQKVDDILKYAKLDLGEYSPKDIQSYSFNEDESMVLLVAESESIYRRSSKEVVFVVKLSDLSVQTLHEGQKISNATISPDGNMVGFCYENNLYLHNLSSGEETQLSFDGKWNELIYGSTDWVYEEELSLTKAFAFSPDGKHLAYYRFDEGHVKQFTIPFYGSLYPELYNFKYPKAGEQNSFVTIHSYDLASKKHTLMDIGTEQDQYIPRIKWVGNETLGIMRLNRLQNQVDVLFANAKEGSSKVVLTEKAKSYIEVTSDKWHFLQESEDFLWMSEQDGYNHVYRYDRQGERVAQLTNGKYEVTEIVGVDEANNKLYYLSSETSPLERQLFVVGLDGKKKKQLTEVAGMHSVTASSAFNYFTDSYSSTTEPGVTRLLNAKGKTVEVLEENKKLKGKLAKLDMAPPSFFDFDTEDGTKLNGWMIKPTNFVASKQYPVLMFVYGGPGSQTVKNEFGSFNYMWYQMLAQNGYIVVSVDNRGTGARGRDFRTSTYPELGKYETMDQISAAKYLGRQSYIDGERIGIWGWSYGGYMTSLCMTKGDGLFKMGIAVAPVTTWRFYDSIYTERYLKTPQLNAEGYDENSPLNFADQLQGKFLLVHGTGDDNVHYQNSMEMVTALVDANKQFDSFFYPNKNHGIYGGYTRYHLYNKMTEFILTNL